MPLGHHPGFLVFGFHFWFCSFVFAFALRLDLMIGPGARLLGQADWPASPRDLPVSTSPVLESQSCTSPGFFIWIVGIQFRSSHLCGKYFTNDTFSPVPSKLFFHSCEVSTLPMTPSPQLPVNFFFFTNRRILLFSKCQSVVHENGCQRASLGGLGMRELLG